MLQKWIKSSMKYIPKEKKSVAISVSIQSDNKTLSENDLNLISEKIIKKVQQVTGGNIRS